MQVTISTITNSEFSDQYSKCGSQFSENGMPTYSIPFEISGAPEGTQSFAVVLEDKDAITASGFVWIHWLIADLTRTSLAENDSISATDYVQGANSWATGQTQHRGGFDLRRHGAAQLPPPRRADCLCTRHQAQSAAGFPFQRFALCDAGSCVGECFGDGYLRCLTSSDAPFAFQQAVARTPVNRVRG